MDTMLGWPRPRTPSGPRSLPYVGLTVPWHVVKHSIKSGLRLLLCLGKLKVSTTLQPYAFPVLQIPRSTQCPRRPVKFKTTHLRLLLQPTLPRRRQSRPRVLPRQGMWINEKSKALTYPQQPQRIPPKEKEASQNMELVLATLPIHSKKDPKDKTKVSSTTANTQPPKDSKEKLVIRMKQ